MDIFLLTLILVGGFGLLISGALRYEITALLIVFALPAAGLLTPGEALYGFANEATITVAAMFVLSAGLSRTGAIEYVTRAATRVRIRSTRLLLLVLVGLAAIPSAFLNNTAVVIVLIPVVLKLCQRNELPASKLMIPLSYITILGGTLTLVGTSTNILVHGLYQKAGGPGFGMFEFTKMGVCYLLIGVAFILVAGPRLLPKRKVLSQLLEPQHRSRFVTEIVIPEGSRLAGNTLRSILSGLDDVKIIEHIRGEAVEIGPPPALALEAGDALLVEGSPRAIHSLLGKEGLDLATAVADAQRVRISQMDLQIVEAVVTPTSSFFNQRLAELGLNRLYGIKVLAVQRRGRHIHARLREMKIQVGDVLLVQGEEASLRDLQNTGDVLLVEGVERTLRVARRAPVAVLIMTCVVMGAALQWLPISILAIGGAAAMLAFKCLRVREAIRSLESSVLLLIAATIPIGLAMEKTGMAEIVARWIIGAAGGLGPVALVSAVYLFTMVFTECLSNNAVAVLATPIVLEMARGAGMDPKPLLVAVAFGASACFATPIGYQTNLLVMGPGGYYFRDYMRIGIALDLVLWVAATILIPVFWPLT